MTQLTPNDIKRRSDTAWQIRDMWKGILQEAYELVFAGINPYAADKKNPKPMDRQYDSTATASVVRLANRIVNEMTPPHDTWVDIQPGPLLELQLGDQMVAGLKETLAGVSKMANMVVNTPGAIAARHTAILDCLISGMGCILGLENNEDDVRPMSDIAVSQSEVAIEVNPHGEVSGVYRKRRIKIREIKSVWPDAEIPAEVLQSVGKDKDPEIDVLEATYEGGPKSNVPWYYDVLFCQKDKDPVRMVERVYDVNPWTILRWMVIPGMPYGPGPVLLALADVRTANRVMEMILKNAALALAGMYLVADDGVLNPDNIVISAGGLIPVARTGGNMGASMVPLSTNREFDTGNIVLDNLRMTIKKHLYDGTLPPETGQPRSATEWVQRAKELNQDLGVGIGMMQSDIIQYVRRRIEMLSKRGLIPVVNVDQFTLKIQVNSPLARAQKLSQVENVMNWLQMWVGLAGNPQAVSMAVSLERVVAWTATMMGIPAELLLSDAEKQKIQQNAAALAATQASASIPAQAA